jgi:hypothetical protein
MTPKENAEELYDKFFDYAENNGFLTQHNNTKKCALIAVDVILKSEPRSPSDVDWDDVGGTHQYYYEAQREEADKYWQQVKKEIEEL